MENLFNPDYDKAASIYEFSVLNIKGEPVKLDIYDGCVCLIVNVASKSRFATFNYNVLNALYEKFESEGLRILAFPCNQFGNEEPGSSEEIQEFAAQHGVKFDLFGKINVNGEETSPLWKFLKKMVDIKKVSVITSSFTKFIVNRKGEPMARFAVNADENILANALLPFLNARE